MALDSTLDMAAQVSAAVEEQGDLVVAGGRLEVIQKDQAMSTILEVGKLVGRVQSAQVLATVADSIQASQLRQLKELHKEAGLTWEETCNIIGISRRIADQYLKLAADLGEEFFGDCRRLGVSVRTMEAARQLPEPVRQALAQGEVVDLETVSKEALTDAIKQLAREHSARERQLEEAADTIAKARDAAEKKARTADGQLVRLENELESLREGLDADEARVLRALHEAERPIAAHMVRIKNTLDLAGRSPAFIARLVSGLEFIRALAEYTARVVLARAEGLEPDEEALGAEARQLNRDIADADGAAPHPGI